MCAAREFGLCGGTGTLSALYVLSRVKPDPMPGRAGCGRAVFHHNHAGNTGRRGCSLLRIDQPKAEWVSLEGDQSLWLEIPPEALPPLSK